MKPRYSPHASSWRRKRVAFALAAALFFAGAASVHAFVFALGDVNGSFDTTLSIGVLSRLNNPDPALYGITNTFNGIPGQAYSVNGDDGDLNYGRGIDSILFKVTHDLELKWHGWDAFFRGYYFYDPKNEDTTRPHTPLSHLAKQQVGADAVLLDNYVTGKFELGSTPVTLRLGRQVISWGESTFIPNGINVINPVDVARLRAPGSELREALLPVYAWDTSVALTDKLSVEAVWLLEFRHTEIDPDGTYFSTNDFAGRGGQKVMLGFGALADNQSLGAIPRANDREPRNYGQWGLATHYLATNLNHSEFGFYYLNYSSRLPLISAITPTGPISATLVQSTASSLASSQLAPAMIANGYPAAGVPAALNTLLGAAFTNVPAAALPASLQPFYPSAMSIVAGAKKVGLLTAAATGRYFVEYPKNIGLLGASFNTDVGTTGISLQGEISYKHNVPLQVDDVELLFATLSALDSPGGSVFGTNNQLGNYAGRFGTEVSGFRRLDVWQAQATATKVFGPMLGASQLTVVGEVGVTSVPDLPSKHTLRFDGSGTSTAGDLAEMVNTGNIAVATPSSAFPDKTSWGYQVVGKLDYNNLFAGINFSPSVGFAHDVGGNTPLPLGNFVHNRKTLTLGAEFTFQNQWSFELRYVNYFGGGDYNLLSDRDYVSATLKYSF
jgi:hypothetical protein